MSEMLSPLDSDGKVPLDPGMFPRRDRSWWQLLLDHNPCLLLSTVMMLLGCYLIRSAMEAGSGDQFKMLLLLITVNVYEACIIPLGLFLVRRTKGTARDGLWLILFEALFLVNGTFLNVDPNLLWGWTLNIVLLALALVKAWFLFRGLGIGISLRTWGFLALQLVMIYGMPIFLWYASTDGRVSPRTMVVLWWFVGMLPVLYDVVAKVDPRAVPSTLVETVIRRTYLMLPWVLMVVHLRFSHWAHHCDFGMAYTAPVFLGLMVALTRVAAPVEIRGLSLGLPIVAMIAAGFGESEMAFVLPAGSAVREVSPLFLTVVASVLSYAYLVSLWAVAWTAVGMGVVFVSYMLQEYIIDAVRRMLLALGAIFRTAGNLFPTTVEGWGIASVISAFVLLGAGALVSVRRTRTPPPTLGG